MLSILLAIALFFAFFLVAAGFGDASTRESREIRRQTLTTLAKPVSLLSITEAFDPIYAILWQAPIAALELVESAGAQAYQLHNCIRFLSGLLPVSQRSMRVAALCNGSSF
jgi:hypothetical protein